MIKQLGHLEEDHAEKLGTLWSDTGIRAQKSICLPRKSLVSLLEEGRSHLKFGSTSHKFPCWFVLIVSQRLDFVE